MSEPPRELFSRPTLRYRRLGGGYRREDVEAALEQLLGSLRRLDLDLTELRAHAAKLEEELRRTQAELEAYRAREAQLAETLSRAEEALARARGLAAASAGDDLPVE
jgi:chromosome segregation ATPase